MQLSLTPVWTSRVQDHAMALDLPTDRIVRLRISAGDEFAPDYSYAIANDSWLGTDVEKEEGEDVTVLKTESLAIEVGTEPFRLRIADQDGHVRFETTDDGIEFTKEGICFIRSIGNAERIYGMGEQGETLDKIGHSFRFWNSDHSHHVPNRRQYCEIPFSIHMTPDGVPPTALFLDNPGEVNYDLGSNDPSVMRMTARTGDFVLWILFEDSIKELLSSWARMTGHMERPPVWSLGFQQCRWSYFPDKRVREIAEEFRTRRIPCDVIYLDIDYMRGYRVFTWHSKRFPDPDKLLRDLRDQGFRVVTIVDPGVKIDEKYEVFQELSKAGEAFIKREKDGEYLVDRVWPGKCHFPDFTNPEVRLLWGEYQNRELLERGVAGVWNDMNEPALFDHQDFAHPASQHDFGLNRRHEEIHQIYGLTMAQASYEGFLKARPQERPLIITRSGWAGIQRYSMMWTGDNHSTWQSMAFCLQLNLSMAMAGVPFVGCDIGGFGGDCEAELFARWMEWGVFQPFCRVHSCRGTRDQEPWSFGGSVERIARQMIELRMRLLPYLYACFVHAAETGQPINRPLVCEYPNDAAVHRLGDQFLVGPDILVAPVLFPGHDRRLVYLPPGVWYHFWSDQRLEGGRWEIFEAPLSQPPVFVRAGAVIPMHPVRQHTGEPEPRETYLDVYPGTQLRGGLVEDDGLTQAWRNGIESRITFTGWQDDLELRLYLSEPDGEYRSARDRWTVRLHTEHRSVASVTCNGVKVPFERDGSVVTWSMDEERAAIEVSVAFQR